MFNKAKKKLRDRKTVAGYRDRLRAERKIYTQTAETYSDTDRKSRCLAVGECCIQTLEAIGQLNLQHRLIPGTLEYMIDQQKVQDETGRKGFRYQVQYMVRADEPAYTEDQIREKTEDLARRLHVETEEMFGKVEEEDEDNKSHRINSQGDNMEKWDEKLINQAKQKNPDCCGHCPCCDFSMAADCGDCLVTDESLLDIWKEKGKNCPIDK